MDNFLSTDSEITGPISNNIFSQFNIKVQRKFDGLKIDINQIIDKIITIRNYEISDSIKKPGSKYLKMTFYMDGHIYFIYTGAKYLVEALSMLQYTQPTLSMFNAKVKKQSNTLYFEGTLIDE